jgi:uncharacterized protein (TIGR02145 family)
MPKGQRKVKNVRRAAGSASGVGLLLLAFLLVKPLGSLSASALEGEEEGSGVSMEIGEPAEQAETLISTVNIAFTPESGSTSLTPISANGASARYSIKATVGVENSGGYTVYLGSNKSELTGRNSGATINGVTSSSTYEELPLNTWGYNAIEGETPGTTFSKVPTNNRGDIIASNNSTNIKEDNRTFTLSFAAHIGNDKPADTYENEITLSVVSSPLEVVGLKGIAAMQEMTPEVCAASELGDTKQLVDLRDNRSYWVKKMPDNGCWMVQNLDLDLGSSWPDARLSDYTVASTTYKPTATQSKHASVDTSQINTRSWNFGEWVVNNPTVSSSCGLGKNDLTTCAAQFVNVSNMKPSNDPEFYKKNGKTVVGNVYDAHYLVGNHYAWNTATAGTGATITNGQASGSICPKGWKLPTSNSSVSGSFGGLLAVENIGKNVAKLTGDGYFFVRGGGIYQEKGLLFGYGGDYGVYWSSTPYSTSTNAFDLYFSSTNIVEPSSNYYRNNGYSVRCVAR